MGTKNCPVSNTFCIGIAFNEKKIVAPVNGTLLVETKISDPKEEQEWYTAFGAAVKVVTKNKAKKLVNCVGNFSRIDF
jgi:hypothetical protein